MTRELMKVHPNTVYGSYMLDHFLFLPYRKVELLGCQIIGGAPLCSSTVTDNEAGTT